MARQPFLTFREEDEGILKYFIVQKEFPHHQGLICTQPNLDALAQGTVSGYNLWIVSAGVLRGNFIAVYPSYKEDQQLVFDSMANWFYSERILKDEKRYERFKVKVETK